VRPIKLSATIFAASLFLIACNSNQPQQTAQVDPNANNVTITQRVPDQNEYWAKDNLDLQRVGNLLERSKSPQQFESYLNSNDGINNLDLNGDGYADYISVQEYQDRGTNERGLSLFSRFGPDLIQEIATIILYRDNLRSPGARILLTGNDQIYGDNYYYEANWMDRSLGIANLLFGNRNTYYTSPYYYNNYPNDYRTYQVVDTPYYRTRIERLYPQPVFVYTTNPDWITYIKIMSPNNGLHLGQIKARLVKPTQEQEIYFKNNPRGPKGVKADKPDDADKGDKGNNGGKKDDVGKPDDQPKENPKPMTKDDKPGKPDKVDKPNVQKQNAKPAKQDNGGKDSGKGGGKGKKP
jgi:hypothetical protein